MDGWRPAVGGRLWAAGGTADGCRLERKAEGLQRVEIIFLLFEGLSANNGRVVFVFFRNFT